MKQDDKDARMKSVALIQGHAVADAKAIDSRQNKFKDFNETSEKKSQLFHQNVIGPRAKIEAEL